MTFTLIALVTLGFVVGGASLLRWILLKKLEADAEADRARLQRVTHDAAQRSIAAADYAKFTRRRTDRGRVN